jgi:hypothetical protein
VTDDELKSLIDEEVRGAVGYNSSELSNQRRTALEYFYGEPFGNEMEGRSTYVSPDVRDTILWIMPSLMRIFTGGDHIVRFEPQGPEDEQAADQATDYVNHVFQKQNDGFLTLHTWFMDALMSKNGFVKVYWEEYDDYKTTTYDGLTEDEFAYLAQDEKTEILEHSQFPGPMGMLHAVKIRSKKNHGKCSVVPVPPEEVLVNRHPVSPLSKNRFIAHRRKVTISELKEMGFKDVDDLQGDEGDEFNEEKIARFSFDETDEGTQDEHKRPETREVWLSECFVKVDFDGDGIAEDRTILKAGNRILSNEEGHSCRLVTLTPIPLPHKLYGMSIADLVMDLQLLKSTIFRQILDNMYLANNGRYMALDGMVNIDDLLTSRPGGIVRVKTFDAVKPMQPPLLGAPAFNLLEYVDHIKDVRTGVNRDLQGLDPDTINKTATAQSNRLGAAQSRIELIARIFAETGVKDLFYAILETVQKHQKQAQVIRLRNEWVTMDPQEWQNKFDLSVSVGLGTGSKDSIIGGLLETLKLQFTMLQGGLPGVTPKNVYNTAMELLKAQSIKSGDLFFTDPDTVPPQPQQPDPALLKAEMDGQIKMALQDMKNQAAQEKQATRQEFDAMKEQFKAGVAAESQNKELSVQLATQKQQQEAESQRQRESKQAEGEMKLVDILWERKKSEEEERRANDEKKLDFVVSQIQENTRAQNEMLMKVIEASMAEKEIVRDEKGKAKGVRPKKKETA